MKLLLLASLILLSGCAQQNVKEAMDNLSHDCTRHYTFSLSTGTLGMGTSVTVAGNADCAPEGVPKPPVVTQ